VADDTGLEVAALGGAPGVHTARFAGEDATYADNRAKLLATLAGRTDRAARFRTVAMVVWPDGRELAVEGVCDGTIPDEERGQRGFGYDAVFRPDEGDGRTFAEMSEDEKSAVSHRGRAFRGLLSELVGDGTR
jgi:XTP/dITP diphosphohydrolase